MRPKLLICVCTLTVLTFAGERTYACPYQNPIADFYVSPATYAFDPTLGKYVYYVCVGEVITFDGSDPTYSYDPDSELFSCAYVASWEWDFYNNDTVDYTADVITHTFGTTGPVDVNLTVTDNDSACCSLYGTTCDDKSDSIMYTVVAVKVEFLPDLLYVCKGGTASLTATVTPSSASSQVDFDTAAPSIATVSGSAPNLTVHGVSAGTTQVRAKLGDCVCETAEVTVVKVENVTFDPTALCADGSSTSTASATITPDTRTITWSIQGDALGCSINSSTGVITAGTTAGTITVRAADSVLSDCCYAEADIDVVKVEIVSVDASDPFNTKINYCTNPLSATIPSVTFTAPGKTDSKTNVSGNFYFTYDQCDVGWGSNTIRLAYLGTHVDCSVTKTTKMPEAMEVLCAYFAVRGVGLRVYNHTLREIYYPHVYSVAYSGKTIRTCHSIALMDFKADYYNICGWSENHRYLWNGGGTSWVAMTPVGGWLPPNTHARKCNTVMWCIPNSLEGIAKCVGLFWDYGGGATPAIITNAEVDRSMPE